MANNALAAALPVAARGIGPSVRQGWAVASALGCPALCMACSASRTRRRSRPTLARPKLCRLGSLRRLICPSARPLLQGLVNAARIAAPSSPTANVSTAPMPHARAYASQASSSAMGVAGTAPFCRPRTPQARTGVVNRRARPAAILASSFCSTRLTTSASAAFKAVTGWSNRHESCRAAGRFGAQGASPTPAAARHRCVGRIGGCGRHTAVPERRS